MITINATMTTAAMATMETVDAATSTRAFYGSKNLGGRNTGDRLPVCSVVRVGLARKPLRLDPIFPLRLSHLAWVRQGDA